MKQITTNEGTSKSTTYLETVYFQNNLPQVYVQSLTDIYVGIWHSEDRASWFILVKNANKMHYF